MSIVLTPSPQGHCNNWSGGYSNPAHRIVNFILTESRTSLHVRLVHACFKFPTSIFLIHNYTSNFACFSFASSFAGVSGQTRALWQIPMGSLMKNRLLFRPNIISKARTHYYLCHFSPKASVHMTLRTYLELPQPVSMDSQTTCTPQVSLHLHLNLIQHA